jgi:HD superfamily phosphodiesterase
MVVKLKTILYMSQSFCLLLGNPAYGNRLERSKVMNHRQIQLIKELSQEAVRLFWEDSFGGRAYGSRHLQRVQCIAEYLREKEGGDEFLVLAGAWVHDVALAHGPDYDPERVAELTRQFLIQFTSLQKDEIDGLVACAEGHESGGDFLSLEAKLVHDADVLDKGGLLGVVRHVWKMTNMLDNRILKDEHDLKRLEDHLRARQERLYTNTARRLADYLKGPLDHFFRDRRFARETMVGVSRLAARGIISDKVAETFASRNNHPCLEGLKHQLECRYLDLDNSACRYA